MSGRHQCLEECGTGMRRWAPRVRVCPWSLKVRQPIPQMEWLATKLFGCATSQRGSLSRPHLFGPAAAPEEGKLETLPSAVPAIRYCMLAPVGARGSHAIRTGCNCVSCGDLRNLGLGTRV